MNAPAELPTTQLPAKFQFKLKRLSPKHKQVAALLAQGLGREDISRLCQITPEYVTMLAKQDLFIAYVKEMTAFTDVRLQALFDKAVDTTATLMNNGSEHVKLAAAQTVLKAVGKDGASGNVDVSMKFVVHVPPKAASPEDWLRGRTLEQRKEDALPK